MCCTDQNSRADCMDRKDKSGISYPQKFMDNVSKLTLKIKNQSFQVLLQDFGDIY